MRSLLPLWHCWLRFYYSWAAREIARDHPDAAYIAVRLSELGVR